MPDELTNHWAEDIRPQIDDALRSLSDREALVLRLRYGLIDGQERTVRDVAVLLRLSPRNIREIEAQALRKLKFHEAARKIVTVRASVVEVSHVSAKATVIPGNIHVDSGDEPLTDRILFPPSESLFFVTSDVGNKLVEYFAQHPDELKTMDRYLYEHLISELFSGLGYEVELTKRTRDGGIDIIAIKGAEVESRFIIQAKRPNPGNPIGVGPVRELLGVKTRDRATKAILATTTYFTRDARSFAEPVRWELELRDYDGIIEWLEEYQRIRGGESLH